MLATGQSSPANPVLPICHRQSTAGQQLLLGDERCGATLECVQYCSHPAPNKAEAAARPAACCPTGAGAPCVKVAGSQLPAKVQLARCPHAAGTTCDCLHPAQARQNLARQTRGLTKPCTRPRNLRTYAYSLLIMACSSTSLSALHSLARQPYWNTSMATPSLLHISDSYLQHVTPACALHALPPLCCSACSRTARRVQTCSA
jgi:hypothetical protein